MSKRFNPDTLLESDNRLFAVNTLKVLRYIMLRMKVEGRKSWKHEDLIHLMEKLIAEAGHPSETPVAPSQTAASSIAGKIPQPSAPAELPEEREDCIIAGKSAFTGGAVRNSNPYTQGSDQYKWWDIGWHDAERARKADSGGTVAIQSGRDTSLKKDRIYYRIQLKENSIITEWNEPLHQYSEQGHGTLFMDYDEAQSVADLLAKSASGIVSVIAVKSQ